MKTIVARARRLTALKTVPLAALLACAMANPAKALTFSSSAQVWGYVNTSFTSPYLGDISFSIPGSQDYQSSQPGALNPQATATYSIDPNLVAGNDPVYDIVTAGGTYGFGYTGTAKATGTLLHAIISTSQVDQTGLPTSSAGRSSVNATAYSSWNQTLFIAANALHPLGSYGATLVQIKLDGGFSPTSSSDGSGYASLQLASSFVDTAGVNYQSSFSLSANSGDPSWTGSQSTYKKLLFQYGTPFTLSAYMYASAAGNITSDFFNTGKVTSIEVPFGATLQSGAEEAGLGTPTELYGVVFNSATLDAVNTNWDFGNNGGGFTPTVPVPEPGSWAMLAAGLAAMGFIARQRRRA